jgi:hypothetical protein
MSLRRNSTVVLRRFTVLMRDSQDEVLFSICTFQIADEHSSILDMHAELFVEKGGEVVGCNLVGPWGRGSWES